MSELFKRILLVLVKFVAPISVAIVLCASLFYRFYKPDLSKVKPDDIATKIQEFNAIRDISWIILAVLIVLSIAGVIMSKAKSN